MDDGVCGNHGHLAACRGVQRGRDVRSGRREYGDSQLTLDRVTASEPGTFFLAKSGRDIQDDANTYPDFLERAYAYVEAGASNTVRFRVSLFAGDASNRVAFEYPRLQAALPVPVPPQDGIRFGGWMDAAGHPVTAETPVEADGPCTLVAS